MSKHFQLIIFASQLRFKCETVLKEAKDWEVLAMSVLADDSDPNFIAKLGPATRTK
jgi:hypothetical protein